MKSRSFADATEHMLLFSEIWQLGYLKTCTSPGRVSRVLMQIYVLFDLSIKMI